MAKVTESARQQYVKQVACYQQQIDALLIREKNMVNMIEKDSNGASYKRLMLTDEMLFLTTLYLAKHYLSVTLLGVKNEDALNDARKTLYKAVI